MSPETGLITAAVILIIGAFGLAGLAAYLRHKAPGHP